MILIFVIALACVCVCVCVCLYYEEMLDSTSKCKMI
jgi:hypothetical protein